MAFLLPQALLWKELSVCSFLSGSQPLTSACKHFKQLQAFTLARSLFGDKAGAKNSVLSAFRFDFYLSASLAAARFTYFSVNQHILLPQRKGLCEGKGRRGVAV